MMTDYIKPAAKRAGIPHISYHPLRHSYKTWVTRKKVPLEHQKNLPGHADIGTTADYCKTLSKEMRTANKLATASRGWLQCHIQSRKGRVTIVRSDARR